MNEAVLEAFRKFRPAPAAAWAFANPAARAFMMAQIERFPSAALPDLENPTVLTGIVHEGGRGELWMLTGEGFRRTAPLVRDLALEMIPMIYSALKLHRLQLTIESGRADAALWARRLGFEYETTLKRASRRATDLDIFLWPHNERENVNVD